MKTVGGAGIAVGLALALGIGAVHAWMPPNKVPEEGAADPFLFLRRPVLKALDSLPFVKLSARPHLPSFGGYTVTEGEERRPFCNMEIRREPVYQGPFRKVGTRVAYRLRYFRAHDEDWRSVRLCYAVGPRRHVAAEKTAPGPDLAEVSGFVPSSARGFWVEYTDAAGAVHSMDGWGDTDPFWRE